MFKNFDLSDDEVLEIVTKYENLINKYSKVNREIDEDLKQKQRLIKTGIKYFNEISIWSKNC